MPLCIPVPPQQVSEGAPAEEPAPQCLCEPNRAARKAARVPREPVRVRLNRALLPLVPSGVNVSGRGDHTELESVQRPVRNSKDQFRELRRPQGPASSSDALQSCFSAGV